MSEYYIGLMSGTSMDGIDAALVEFNDSTIRLIASHSHPLPSLLKDKLKLLSQDSVEVGIDTLGEADTELGITFAEATNSLLKKARIKAEQITAIGSHGQTIRHRPDLKHNFSLQIGDANRISYLTGITTVADFRRKDMAAGGEGAPLAPAFHQQVFHSPDEDRAILNIGGISNLTFLPADKQQASTGFDCGPGNALMDAWIKKNRNEDFDNNGEWAASSNPDQDFLNQLMQDDFLSAAPPKSTGKEHYNLTWLEQQLTDYKHLSTAQVQASLCQFTCDSIIHSITQHLPIFTTLIICGGGVHNALLMEQLTKKLPHILIASSEAYGVDPDWVEAIAFAWLAQQTINKKPGNLPSVTGASKPAVLGAIYLA